MQISTSSSLLLSALLLGCNLSKTLAAPTLPSLQTAIAGCHTEKDKSIFWSNSLHSQNAEDIAGQYSESHDLITMDDACGSIMDPTKSPMKEIMAQGNAAIAKWSEIVAEAFSHATVNAGSKVTYVVLPDAGAGPTSMWTEFELPIIKGKMTIHKISLEHPKNPMTTL